MYNKRELRKVFPTLTILIMLFLTFTLLILTHFDQPTDESRERVRIHTSIKRSEDNRKRFLSKREMLLEDKGLSKIDPWSSNTFFWDYFPPTFTCPFSVERVGGAGDGGKWLCGFDLLSDERRKDCLVYSFGVGPDSSFELEFYSRTNCLIYAFDYTVDGIRLLEGTYDKRRVHFEKLGLGNVSEGVFRTLGDILRANNHGFIDYLKVDIEGAEFTVFEQIFHEFETLPFGNLNLEVHLNLERTGGEEIQRFYNFWNRLEEKGLRAFFWETNHYPCVVLKIKPFAHEYSFVNLHHLQSVG